MNVLKYVLLACSIAIIATGLGFLILIPYSATRSTPQQEEAHRCADSDTYLCSIAELESILKLDLQEPDLDDAQFVFIKASWDGLAEDPTQFTAVTLYYQCLNDECDLRITEVPTATMDKSQPYSWGKTPASAVEPVQLTMGTGEYVRGWFTEAQVGRPEAWNPDMEIQRLYWVTDDLLIMLGLDGNFAEKPIQKQDLISIANGMK